MICSIFLLTSLFAVFLAVVIIFVYIALILLTIPFTKIKRYSREEDYLDPSTNERKKFPSLDEPPSIYLSIIIPAYNEAQRLPVMLDECLTYLESKNDLKYELIIVSDGSKDNTVQVGLNYAKKYGSNKIRVLELIENRGKGGAVRLGMLSSRGALLLFADADGATKFSDFDKLESAMEVKGLSLEQISSKLQISIGSRSHLEKEAIASRTFFRNVLMHGFHYIVWIFCVRSVKDTQCGFKLFTRSAARILFKNLHIERWAFDVELLFIAEFFSIPIKEICVNWTEIDGSKVTPVISWIQMGCDLVGIWFMYVTNLWQLQRIDDKKSK